MFMPWFVPWCVNERISWINAKAAINDPTGSLTKSTILRSNLGTYWKIRGPLSVSAHQAIKCVILTPLVKCARNHSRMTHNIAIQAKLLSGPRSRQNDKFTNFKFFKEKSNTIPLHLLRSLCIPIQLKKSLSIPLLTLEIMTTTIGTVQLAADCCKLHQVEYRLPIDWAKPTKIIIFE